MCSINVAELLQVCRKTLRLCFVSSVWTPPHKERLCRGTCFMHIQGRSEWIWRTFGLCRQAVPHIAHRGRTTTISGPTKRLAVTYRNSTHSLTEDGWSVLLQNAGNIATIYARPSTPKYAKEPLLSEESSCGIFGGLTALGRFFS